MEIGLFPLGIVLLPTERIPLHIFEERYKELIGECLEQGTEFGLIMADDDGMRRTGTRAAVVEVVRRFPDGRMDILVEGGERFRLEVLTEGRSFMTGAVIPVADTGDDVPEAPEVARCVEAYQRLADAAGEDAGDLDEFGSIAFQVAARIDLPAGVKQELLESVSERERLDRVASLLEELEPAIRRRRLAEDLAPGNGHVP
jgi:Lon protease-like protein